MSLRRWMPAAAIAAILALPLAACTPAQPTPTPTPTSAHTPLFASDEEALKAATEAYAAYLKMSDTISHDGGANPERIKPYATGNAVDLALRSAQQYREAKAKATGATTFSNPQLQQNNSSRITFYACEDTSDVQVFGPDGKSMAPPDRQTKFPVAVTATNSRTQLVISDETNLDISGVCS